MKKTNEEIIAAYKKSEVTHMRYNAKKTLILQKAEKAGIKVSDAEVDAYLKGK